MLTKVGIILDVAAEKAVQTVERFRKSMSGAEADVKKTDKAITDFQAKMGAAAAGVMASIHAVDQWAERVGKVSGVMDNAAMSIDKARKATRGLVSDFDLQRLANNAALLKVAETDEAFANLAGSAQKLGRSIGQGPVESIESMMAALGRGSSMMLDNLGISLKVEDAQKEYAKQLGITADRLTEVQKSEAFRIIASQKIVEAANNMTDATNKSADAVTRLKVELEDTADAIALWAANDLAESQESMREAFQSIAGGGVEINDELKIMPQLLFAAAQATRDMEKKAAAALVKYHQIGEELMRINGEAMQAGLKILDKERLRDIERELALHGDRKSRQSEVNRLLNEQAELKAKALTIEGKIDEAEEVLFQNELRQIRSASAMGRGGGSGKNRWEGTEIGSMQSRGSGIAMASDRADFQDQMSGVEMQRAGQGAQQAQDDLKIKQLEERQARMNEFDKFANEQLENEKRRLEEEAEATKKAEEAKRKEIELTMRSRMQIADATQALASQSAALAGFAAEAGIKGGKRREAAMKAIAGSELITIGIVETVKAVAAFAGFNYVEGALHVGAAALAFARGGQLISQAGKGGGGGGSSGGFAGGAAFGGGTQGGGGVQSSSGGDSRPTNNGPVSESEESVQRSGRGGRGSQGLMHNTASSPTINVMHFGQIDDATGIKIHQALKRTERKAGRTTS